jgi:hypothetical protein
MKALTIKQPWCAAIVYGTKRVENRSWTVPPAMIGATVALHAGKSVDVGARAPAGEDMPVEDWPLAFGAVIGTARIAGCHPVYKICNPTGVPATVCTPWSIWGQAHWLLADVRPLAEPVPCKGALGLWNLPEDVEAAATAQLEASHA